MNKNLKELLEHKTLGRLIISRLFHEEIERDKNKKKENLRYIDCSRFRFRYFVKGFNLGTYEDYFKKEMNDEIYTKIKEIMSEVYTKPDFDWKDRKELYDYTKWFENLKIFEYL